jgi:putrescine transport system permease protein
MLTNWTQLWYELVRILGRRYQELSSHIHRKRGRYLVVATPMLWLGLMFAIPLLIVLRISFSEAQTAQPPYTSLFEWVDQTYLTIKLSFANYQLIYQDSIYLEAFENSLKIAVVSTFFTLLVGYPMAYAIAKAPPKKRLFLLMLVVLPFWTSSLLRTYAWIGLLKANGLINNLLIALHLIREPLEILYTNTAVYIGIVYCYLPFMVLPLVANLMKLDNTLLEAASDLGCRPWKSFLRITLPLSMPGMVAGSLLVFIPALGEYVIPDLLGGKDSIVIGRQLWTEFFTNTDWPLASSIAIVMLLVIVVPMVLFEYLQNSKFSVVRK